MISAIFAAAVLLASGAPATAPSTAAPAPADAAAADKAKTDALAKGDEVVCKTEQVLGTKFAKRVCRTRAAIAAQRENDQGEISRIQREQRLITN